MPSETGKRKLGDLVSDLNEVLAEREKELDEREKKLENDRERLEIDRAATYGETDPSDVISLNVGGVSCTTLRRTLTLVPGSMLASKFSGRWDDSIEKDENGHFFIDEDYALFAPMLSFLRKKMKGDVKFRAEPPRLNTDFGNGLYIEDFYRMIDHYGVQDALYATSLKVKYTSSEDNSTTVVTIDDLRVRATEWSTVELVAIGHHRRVCTFEVTLGDVERCQIGWKFEHPSQGQSVNQTSALDMIKSSLIVQGITSAVTELAHKKGTVVRTENFGKNWYVNGKPIDTGRRVDPYVGDFKTSTSHSSSFGSSYSSHGVVYPAISLQGDAKVTCVEFEN